MLQNGYINTIVKIGIDILCLLASEKDLEAFFISFSFKIYLQIVLPFLRLSEKEKDQITEEPKEFINYSIDIC